MPDIQLAEPTEKCYEVTMDDGSVVYLREEELPSATFLAKAKP